MVKDEAVEMGAMSVGSTDLTEECTPGYLQQRGEPGQGNLLLSSQHGGDPGGGSDTARLAAGRHARSVDLS